MMNQTIGECGISKKQKERSERLKLEKAKRLLEAKGLKVTK